MSTVLEPPPTWALPVIEDPRTKESQFNPIWLKWFVDLAAILTGIGGTSPAHNLLSGLQGGSNSPAQYYHLTQADYNNLVGASFTGTGSIVRATSPTLVTPALGTPASGVLTNCTGLPNASVIGLQPWATMTEGWGSMYLNSSQTIAMASIGTWYAITPGWSSGGILNNVTFPSTDRLTITNAGTYYVSYHIALDGTNADLTHGTVGVSGTANTNLQTQSTMKATSVYSSMGGSGLVTCAANDYIQLMLSNSTTNSATVQHAMLTALRIA